jgi:hypothetical protein
MTNIKVNSQTQKIIVNPATSSVSVINAGPMGPGGVGGGSGGGGSGSFYLVNSTDVIPSPELGAVRFNKDKHEFLTFYGSVTGWRPPWTQPWGEVGTAHATADQTAITTLTDVTGLTVTFTVPTENRRYRLEWYAMVEGANVGDRVDISVTNGSNAEVGEGFHDRFYIQVANSPESRNKSFDGLLNLATGSTQLKLRIERTGSGAVKVTNSTSQAWMTVRDVGPSDIIPEEPSSTTAVATANLGGLTATATATATTPGASVYGPRVTLTAGASMSYVPPTVNGTTVRALAVGANYQALIDAAPEGTKFVFATGTHVLPGSGNNNSGLGAKRYMEFHGAPGSIITRNSGRGKAFIATPLAGNVLLKNLTIQDMVQGSTAETAAVTSLDAPGTYNTTGNGPNRTRGYGWTIQNCTITRCSAGIHAGTETIVEDTDTSGCYGVGIKTWGDRVIVRRCVSNNVNLVQEPGKASIMSWGGSYDSGYESGGIKCWKGGGVIVEDCITNGNGGAGTWSDYGNSDCFDGTSVPRIFRYITALNNLSSGVATEMSDGHEIHHCDIQGNEDWTSGGRKGLNSMWCNGGLGSYNSPNCYIHHNRVINNQGGISLQFRPRGFIGWDVSPEAVPTDGSAEGSIRGTRVENNEIGWNQAYTCVRQVTDDDFPTYEHHQMNVDTTGVRGQVLRRLSWYFEGITWSGNTYSSTRIGAIGNDYDAGHPTFVPALDKTEWDVDYLSISEWRGRGFL